MSAGVAAITSAIPELLPWRVTMALGFVVLVTVANLRGVKEASTVFAAPTYLFIATIFTMLVVGFFRCADGVCPQAISAGLELEARGRRGHPLPAVAGVRLGVDGADGG